MGKKIENLRKRMSVRLVNNAGDYKKFVSKPSFFSRKVFSKNCVAIHEIKPVLTFDKPIYLGFTILDLSKLVMHGFDYKYIERKFRANLLFTDTESLVYEIKTDDIYEDFHEGRNLLDFSDYPWDSKFFDPVNKNVIGRMKDEFKGKIINEFVELKSDMYSLIAVDAREVAKRSQ